ncbi:MAG: SLATT domain-containing protein [Anaerolineales bacterium]
MEIKMFDQITNWKERVNTLQKLSYGQAMKYDKYHYVVGTIAIIFSAIAGATLFSSYMESWVKWTFGTGSIFAAIILASQTFFTHSRKSEKFRFKIVQLVNVRRDIELFEKFLPEKPAERDQRTQEIDERITKIEEQSSDLGEIVKSPKWPWGLLGVVSAILMVILIPLSMNWVKNLYVTEDSENNLVRDSIQQGTLTWEFDPTDPMVKQRIILINTWINEMTTQKAITLIIYLNEKDQEAPVNTTAIGDCFSACSMILMSGTGERLTYSTSRIAIHTHEYPVNVDPYSENTVRYQREIDFFQTFSKIPADWMNREENLYYLTPEQALTFQVIDGILE